MNSLKIPSDLKHQLEFFEKNKSPSLVDNLGIEITEITKEKVTGTMPVDSRTIQPFGILHGGASAAFAETLASIGAWFNIDPLETTLCGLEINANHIRPVTEGKVYGVAIPHHVGSSTQVWGIEIRDESKKLVSISRCTMTAAIGRDKIPALD